MKTFIIAWISTAAVFLGLDAIWLTQVTPRFTRPIIGEVLSDGVRPISAGAFYVIYVTGIVLLAESPLLEGAIVRAMTRAAILGLVAYATYDLTNQATLKVWSTALSLADMAWGAAISAIAAGAASYIATRFR
jgi:uncharacterized membrane protein